MESSLSQIIGAIAVLGVLGFFIGAPLFASFAIRVSEQRARRELEDERKRHIETESFDAISRRSDKEFRARLRREEIERRNGWKSGRGYTPKR